MNKNLLIVILSLSFLWLACEKPQQPMSVSIIPQPNKVLISPGEIIVEKPLRIVCAKESQNNATYLSDVFAKHTDVAVPIEFGEAQNKGQFFDIYLSLGSADEAVGAEGYQLAIGEDGIHIQALHSPGIFYGIQSLLQMLPAGFFDINTPTPTLSFPVISIHDSPRFTYRGMHLDVGRHMFSVSFIKKYIDMLAIYKYNNFHWHLTEDQGWRIEIKKYPLLTEVGSVREQTLIGHGGRPPFTYDGQSYGGFYTQEEIKEIVQYATERHINVIPEIELPGHSLAALAAYPELACTEGPFEVATRWGVFEDIYCSKDEVFVFLENVLAEVIELFPSKYIHIGGDEAPKKRWEHCPDCQKRIKEEGLKDEHELQSYFIQRIEKYLNSKGRQIIGWDEILEGGLAPNATVMSWRGEEGGIAAAKQGHDAIMTPGSHCYFDHYQANPETEPLAIGGYTSLKKVYNYRPIPRELNPEEAKHILGAQGNVWTEYMKTSDHVQYMVLPRMAALAEVNWTHRENKNWKHFQNKIQQHFLRYNALGYNYSKGSYKVAIKTEPTENGTYWISMETEIPNASIAYTLDGEHPGLATSIYDGKFEVNQSVAIKAIVLENGVTMGLLSGQSITFHKAKGMVPAVKPMPSKSFAGGDVSVFTDGLLGSDNFRDGNWLGFSGEDVEINIEFEVPVQAKHAQLRFFQSHPQWVFLPLKWHMEVVGESDTTQLEGALADLPEIQINESSILEKIIDLPEASIKSLKITITSPKKCPDWHRGAGQDAWIFIDEIIID